MAASLNLVRTNQCRVGSTPTLSAKIINMCETFETRNNQMKTEAQYDTEIKCCMTRFYKTHIHTHLDRALALSKEKQRMLREQGNEQRHLGAPTSS